MNTKSTLTPVPASFADTVSSTAMLPAEDPSEDAGGLNRDYTTSPDFDKSDLSMPFLRLGQGLSAEVTQGVASMGDYLVAGFEPEKEVIFIPGRFRVARVYRDKDGILCQSTDVKGKVGVGDPGGDCDVCPLAEWTDVEVRGKTKRQPPACAMGYAYEGYSVTHGMPVKLDLRKTALDKAKFLNTLIQVKGLGNFAILLRSQTQKNDHGTFAIHIITTYAKVDPEDLEQARDMFGIGRPVTIAQIAAPTPVAVAPIILEGEIVSVS